MSYPCQQLLTGRTCGVVLLAVAIITHSIPGGSSARDCSINTNLLWSKDVLGLAPEAYAKLQPLLNYKFYLPDVELRAGLAYYGSARRLRNFVSELLAGNRPLKVGVVGGRSVEHPLAACRMLRALLGLCRWHGPPTPRQPFQP